MFVPRSRLVIGLLLTALCFGGTVRHASAGKRYALVVGVKTYRPGQPLPQLAYTENDADGLAAVLKAGGYDVTLMTQTVGRVEGKGVFNPLSDYIRDQLSAILDNPFLKEDDVVLVALAGHGVQYELIDDARDKTPKFYFCPADADVAKLKTANEITDRNRLIDLGELYTALQKCRAGGKLLMVDACRNDPTKPGLARTLASSTLPSLPPPPGGTAAFFSCSAHQQAFEDKDLQHGVFFHHVIQALRGDADTSTNTRPADQQITLAELSEHVSVSTYDFVRQKFQGAKQAPELKGTFRVSIPLISVASSTDSFRPQSTIPRRPSANGMQTPSAAAIQFVRIRSGTFMMGSSDLHPNRSEKPVHEVTITKTFYAGKYEVTIGQILTWLNFPGIKIDENWIDFNSGYGPIRKSGSRFVLNPDSEFAESEQQPMFGITWHGAKAFCDWCSKQDTRFAYRLPTEAEWEYAARAGSRTAYPWGDSLNGHEANVNGTYPYGTDTKGPYLKKTVKVGSYPPNDWGLYDTVGNALEWCEDKFDPDFYMKTAALQPDPLNRSRSYSSFVVRGGSWGSLASNARSAHRDGRGPYNHSSGIGFRVVAERVSSQ